MPSPEKRQSPPEANRGASNVTGAGFPPSVVLGPGVLRDLDALAEHLSGRFVVQVVVDAENDHRRTHVYRSCAAAERAVERARARGQVAHVSLVQMLPVGVVVGLGVTG